MAKGTLGMRGDLNVKITRANSSWFDRLFAWFFRGGRLV